MIKFHLEVNATGLHCPLPLLRLKKAMQEIESEQVIKIIATDPAAHLDIGVYSEQVGHQIIDYQKDSEQQIFYIKKR